MQGLHGVVVLGFQGPDDQIRAGGVPRRGSHRILSSELSEMSVSDPTPGRSGPERPSESDMPVSDARGFQCAQPPNENSIGT